MSVLLGKRFVVLLICLSLFQVALLMCSVSVYGQISLLKCRSAIMMSVGKILQGTKLGSKKNLVWPKFAPGLGFLGTALSPHWPSVEVF